MSGDRILQAVMNPWAIEHGGPLAVKERGMLPNIGESSEMDSHRTFEYKGVGQQ